jgi:hypothetical protein
MTFNSDWVMTITVEVGPGQSLGNTLRGLTTAIPITGGSVEGPGWKGRVVPGGADWNTALPGELTEFDARYNLLTDEGVLITVFNGGIVPSNLDATVVKTRTTFLVDAHSAHAGLLHGVHVGTLDVSQIAQGHVTVGVYRLV